jgi:hypothetical protein
MAFAQVGAMVQLKNMALFKTQGLVGGEWTDAHDGRTLAVCSPSSCFLPSRLCSRISLPRLCSPVWLHFSLLQSCLLFFQSQPLCLHIPEFHISTLMSIEGIAERHPCGVMGGPFSR